MTYRLYTNDVINGLVDHHTRYYILDSKIVDGVTIAIVFNEHNYIVTYGLQYEELNSICWTQGHYYADLIDAVNKYKSYCSVEEKRQVVVIEDKDVCEIYFVLVVSNYDYDFDKAVESARGKYDESESNELLEDFILEAITEAGYEYEFTGFETVEV